MAALWTKQALVDALRGEVSGHLPENYSGVSIDSRTVQPGEIFFCIKGEKFDGHDFAAKAIENGAGVLIIEKSRKATLEQLNVPMIAVDDVLDALGQLGCAARQRSRAKIIAVTGSVGKTTTKEALRHCLSMVGKVHANPASFNNHWGVPLTLARMPEDTDYGVFEIGMNHPGEIRPLVKMVRPHVAIITRIAAVHFGFFSSLEEIADAKAEIFEGVEDNGTALLNSDDAFFDYLAKKAKQCGIETVRSFGEADFADYRLDKLHMQNDCSCMTVKIRDEEAMVKVGAPGRHIVQNCLAVIGACDCVGADIAHIALALANFSAENGRGARYRLSLPQGGEFTLIDESYNANPASMRAALSLLGDANVGPRGRRIAVLGDMLELGKYSEKLHRELAEPIYSAGVNPIYLVGSEMKNLADEVSQRLKVHYKTTVDEILPLVLADIHQGDVIMVKSSNSIHSSRIVAALIERYKAISA